MEQPTRDELEAELKRLNAILDEIEAMAHDESIDVRLLVELVKKRRGDQASAAGR